MNRKVAACLIVWLLCGYIAAAGITRHFWESHPILQDGAFALREDAWIGVPVFVGGPIGLAASVVHTSGFARGFMWDWPRYLFAAENARPQ